MHFETKATHAGAAPDEATSAVAPPIHLSTTFARAADSTPLHGYSYVREANPTQSRLEEALAVIESGTHALAFGSGIGAASAVLQALEPGSHVVLPDDSYYAMRIMARDFFPKWQLTYDLVAMEDLDAVRRVMKPETKLLWAESPSNPLMKVCDIAALASMAHEGGALFAVDGTFATPALQRPIELGADIVMHSTTKYLGGHSDVAGGAVIFGGATGALACRDHVEHVRSILGATASPFNSWLVLRGIRTLSARMRVHSENAMRVAQFLESHPRVEGTHYPGLPSHPGHDVARKQMSAFGGMLSFRVRDGREAAIAVVAKTKIFISATSLGGTESLIEHRASSEGPATTTPENLLRLSVGLEHPDDLVEDLEQALR
jgi:cystathionine gamma-synthase